MLTGDVIHQLKPYSNIYPSKLSFAKQAYLMIFQSAQEHIIYLHCSLMVHEH